MCTAQVVLVLEAEGRKHQHHLRCTHATCAQPTGRERIAKHLRSVCAACALHVCSVYMPCTCCVQAAQLLSGTAKYMPQIYSLSRGIKGAFEQGCSGAAQAGHVLMQCMHCTASAHAERVRSVCGACAHHQRVYMLCRCCTDAVYKLCSS